MIQHCFLNHLSFSSIAYMNDSLSKMARWFKANKLMLNIKKTKLTLFGTNHTLNNFDDTLLMNGGDITERVDKFKYLGILYYHSWLGVHEHFISSVVSKRIGVICRVKSYLPPSALNLLASTLVFPNCDYCNPVWSNCISEFCNSLLILQNKLAHVLLPADIYTPILNMMNTLHLVCERWNKQILVIVFKCVKNDAPSYFLSSNSISTSSFHSQGTRSQYFNTLVLPSWYNNSGKHTFQYRGALKWNTLLFDIQINLTSSNMEFIFSINVCLVQ